MHGWNRNARTIREMLANDDIPATDKRVRFVGLSNYEAEGGTVRRDLFAEGEQIVFIPDAAKLNRMVSEKLRALADEAKADGWKWVEVLPEVNHQTMSCCRRVHAPELPLTREAQAKIAELEQRRNDLVTQLEENGENDHETEDIDDSEDSVGQRLYPQIDEIDHSVAAIQRNRKSAYSDDVKGTCGVVVSIGHTGSPPSSSVFCERKMRMRSTKQNPPVIPLCRLIRIRRREEKRRSIQQH